MAYTTIDDPSQYFQTALWSGDNATTQDITNDGNSDLQPDWVWVKCRNTGGNGFDHVVFDTSRGVDNNVDKSLSPSKTDSEGLGDNVTTTAQLGGVSAMLSDGFTVREGSIDDDSRYVNESSRTYVAWQWKANGGTTSSNSSGSITSTVQVNSTAGFSIATWTGTGSGGATIGHGLGAVPHWMIVKKRSGTDSWPVYHQDNTSAPETDYLHLDENIASVDSVDRWNDTAPTSTLVTLGDAGAVNGSSATYVGYFFTEIQGYSKFGGYKGNGNSNGPFVYTGFKPAWLLTKKSSASDHWKIYDSKRDTFNDGSATGLKANENENEADSGTRGIDLLSNGFKLRETDGDTNGVGQDFVYMAFAEHPFVSSKGVPVTAR